MSVFVHDLLIAVDGRITTMPEPDGIWFVSFEPKLTSYIVIAFNECAMMILRKVYKESY